MLDRRDHARRATTMFAMAALCAMLAVLVDDAVRSYPSFDGAMNLNVARSIAAGRGYGFRYDSFFAFPAQTDGPFVLPAALMFRLFGINRLTAQSINVVYLLGFACLLPLVLRQAGAPGRIGVLAAAWCLALPGTAEYAVGGYGEIPMLCWILAGLLAAASAVNRNADRPWRRSGSFALAGSLFALAVLTKTIALICVVPALFVCTTFAVAAPRGERFRSVVGLAAGTSAPILCWELFRLASLGSIATWVGWWQLQLGQVAIQSGSVDARFAPTLLAAKLVRHLRLLSDQVGLPLVLLCVWLILPGALAMRRMTDAATNAGTRLVLMTLVLGTLSYFTWWLFITPTGMAWLRRILPALVLQTCLVMLVTTPISATIAPGHRLNSLRIASLALVLAPQLLMLAHGLRLLERLHPAAAGNEIHRVVDTMRSLPPDAVIFGVGWWQAPVLSLFSGRTIMNFDRWSPERINALPDKYLAIDGPARNIGQNAVTEVMTTSRLSAIYEPHDASLYRVLSVDPELPVHDPAVLRPAFDATDTGKQPHAGGWFPAAGGWAWLQPRSHILLARTGQSRLVLDAAFWSELFPPGSGLRVLRVSATGCIDETIIVPGAGLRQIVLRLKCRPVTEPVAFDVTLVLDRAMPLLHQLDADTRLRAFEISRIALVD